MNTKIYSLFFIAVTSAVLFSCKSASKLYEKGNYDEAVEKAAKKLQKDPTDPELLDIIRNSYRYAVNDHESQIRSHGQSSSELKYEWIHKDYVDLQKMYEAIYKVPSVYNIVRPTDYSSYVMTYAEKAGDVRFERGMAFMQGYDKQSYRNAYREFQAALNFKPGDIAAIQKRDEAFDYAVTNVVVLPMQQYGGYVYSNYRIGGNNLDDQIIHNLQFSSGNQFLKFYSAWDARSRNIRTDMTVDMQLATVDIGRYQDSKTTRRVSKEVLIKETVIRPDSIVKEYGWVHADITTTRRTIGSRALLRIGVEDDRGRWIWNDQVGADHAWSTEFATYTGDARALSPSDKALVDKRPERGPDEDEIMRCMLEQISNDAANRIRNFFSSY
jgi:hypothetical protein